MIRRLIPVLVWGILGTAMPSSAEPVRVTSGSYFVDSGDDGEWTLAGPGFSLQGLGLGDLPFWQCRLCPSGSQVSMDARLSPDGNRGPVTWQGQTHEGVFWSGDLFFAAGTATAGFGVGSDEPIRVCRNAHRVHGRIPHSGAVHDGADGIRHGVDPLL
jgi:hypothetical protein